MEQLDRQQQQGSEIIDLILEGLAAIRQERFSEAALILRLAKTQATVEYSHLSLSLEAIIQSNCFFLETQRKLLELSKALVNADIAQQQHLTQLEELLANIPLSQPRPSNLPHAVGGTNLPALYINCFARFSVWREGKPVELCTNRNGQAVLRYLITRQPHRESMDKLMEILWPEDNAEVARHKLRVAVSALRRALNNGYECEAGGGYILYKNDFYELNPTITFQVDVEKFIAHYEAGRQGGLELQKHYSEARRLYTGPFLTEDLYADWCTIQREQLCQLYLNMSNTLAEEYLLAERYQEAAALVAAILKENRWDEAAYRLLMRIYWAEGRRAEALKQYQRCCLVLNEELGVPPMPETEKLFQQILSS